MKIKRNKIVTHAEIVSRLFMFYVIFTNGPQSGTEIYPGLYMAENKIINFVDIVA